MSSIWNYYVFQKIKQIGISVKPNLAKFCDKNKILPKRDQDPKFQDQDRLKIRQ